MITFTLYYSYLPTALAHPPVSLKPGPSEAFELALTVKEPGAVAAFKCAVAVAVVLEAQRTAAGHADQIAELLATHAAPN